MKTDSKQRSLVSTSKDLMGEINILKDRSRLLIVWARFIISHIYHIWLKGRKHTNSRNSGDNLPQFEFIQYCGFTSGIKTNHKNSHLFLSEETREKLPKRQPHLVSAIPITPSWVWHGIKCHKLILIASGKIIILVWWNYRLKLNNQQHWYYAYGVMVDMNIDAIPKPHILS